MVCAYIPMKAQDIRSINGRHIITLKAAGVITKGEGTSFNSTEEK